MNADFTAVLAALPAEARQVRRSLDWTHEKTYRTLVRLYDRGLVRIMRDSKDRGTTKSIWELAEDETA